ALLGHVNLFWRRTQASGKHRNGWKLQRLPPVSTENAGSEILKHFASGRQLPCSRRPNSQRPAFRKNWKTPGHVWVRPNASWHLSNRMWILRKRTSAKSGRASLKNGIVWLRTWSGPPLLDAGSLTNFETSRA